MITPITATFPALNFPKEVDYPTQEDWAAFSAAAELNYGILSGEWSDKSEEFKAQTNNLAQEIQEIGENAFNAISLNTIEDLATFTGTGLVMVKDLNRGGTFIYDATQSAVNNGGTIFNGWVRQYSEPINIKWFNVVNDGVINDSAKYILADTYANGRVVYVPYTVGGINVSGLSAVSVFQFENVFNNAGTSTLSDLNGVVIANETINPLSKVATNNLPIGDITLIPTFNNTLNAEIYFDGNEIRYKKTPYDIIDFTKDGTVYTTYFVNYNLGSNAVAGTATGAGAWKTLDYAITNAVRPALIKVEDDIVGYLSSGSVAKTTSGKLKILGMGNSGTFSLIAGMRESYNVASFAWSASGGDGAYVSSTASAKYYRAQFDSKYRDNKGFPTPITVAASIAECQSTKGTYFWDGVSSLYVHMQDNRIPDPLTGWQWAESPYDFEIYEAGTTANDVCLIENMHFLSNLGTASSVGGFKYRPAVAPALANSARVGLKNCLSYGSNGNGFMFYDADVIITDNCHAKYTRVDGLNYHSYNLSVTNGEFITVYEHNCSSQYSGYTKFPDQIALSESANGSTAHDSLHILRTNGVFSDCHGAVVADVNGTHSLNYNVKAGMPSKVGESLTFKSCFWHDKYLNVGTTPKMYLWGCSAFDNGDIDTSIISNKAQVGTSTGDVYVSNWRGQADGILIGDIKDFNGNIL